MSKIAERVQKERDARSSELDSFVSEVLALCEYYGIDESEFNDCFEAMSSYYDVEITITDTDGPEDSEDEPENE